MSTPSIPSTLPTTPAFDAPSLTAPPSPIPALGRPPHAVQESDRLARLALNHAVEPADPLIGRILAHHSPADVLAAIHADQLADLDPDPARRTRLVDRCAGLKLRLEPGQVESGIAAADAVGARFITPGDADWPLQLDDLGELRPIGIWVIGRWPPTPANASAATRDTPLPRHTLPGQTSPLQNAPAAPAAPTPPNTPTPFDTPPVPSTPTTPAAPTPHHTPTPRDESPEPYEIASAGTPRTPTTMIAVVGARAWHPGYGAYIAGTIGAACRRPNPRRVRCSAGHRCGRASWSARRRRPDIAVLACGIDRVYPRGHEVLLRAIAERGAVLSELPPGSSPTRFRFLHRNRIIAALGAGTVVVEAARRSGSLVTARLTAGELGRVVMAVPGP